MNIYASSGQYAADFGGFDGLLERAYPGDPAEQARVELLISEIHRTINAEAEPIGSGAGP